MTLAIVDSGVANVASVMAAMKRLNVDAEITSDGEKIRTASHVILPGVGAASAAMTQLESKKLTDTLRHLTQPVLGICLGMQLLFTRSDEGGGVPCLDVIQGNIQSLSYRQDMPIPHMGWNQINIHKKEHSLLRDIPENSFVYFVHSFAAPVDSYTIASCDYSNSFTAVAGYKNFFGCQFHPERSSLIGSQIIKNFLGM